MYWLQISSGRGPAECCWVVHRFVEHLLDIADQNNIEVILIKSTAGDFPNTLKSALLAIEGEKSAEFIKHWQGSIKWVGKSMFRPTHKRNNWFIDVNALVPETKKTWQSKDIRIDTLKSSGPGGQHVNSTDSAVRVTHIPSGLSTQSQSERSQHLNKKFALTRLRQLLEQRAKDAQSNLDQKKWGWHNELERGNAAHVFTGKNFKHKK